MPFELNTGLPLAYQAQPVANPLQLAMAAQQFQAQRENMLGLREQREAIAEERRAATAQREHANRVAAGAADSMRAGGGVRKAVLEHALANTPEAVPTLTKYFDESDKSAAELRELQNKLKEKQLDHVGHIADRILAHGATPDALQTGLALYAEQFPDEAGEVQKLGEQLQGAAPEQIKAVLERQRESAPFWQAQQQKAAERGPVKVSPGETVLGADNKPVYTAPERETAPGVGTLGDFMDSYAQSVGLKSGKQLNPRQKLQAKAQFEAAGRAPAADNEPLVAIMGPDGQPVLVKRSQAEGKRPASNKEQGRPVTSGDAGTIAEQDSALDDLKTLRGEIPAGETGVMARAGAMLPNVITEWTGIGATAKTKQAVIDRVKQVIGKAMEGGVLRKEDEAKYEKILPTLGDSAEVVTAKLDGVEKMIQKKQARLIDALGDAGYDTSKFTSRPPRPPQNPNTNPNANAGGKVAMVAPDGRQLMVPADKVAEMESHGARKAGG